MKLNEIVKWSKDKTKFETIEDYSNFCEEYLAFIQNGLQAVIVSKNENDYCFFQYKKDGEYNVTRPINGKLMYNYEEFLKARDEFNDFFNNIKEIEHKPHLRETLNRYVYTAQQSIGLALDALPSGKANTARKINGDLFENYIRLLIKKLGISVESSTVSLSLSKFECDDKMRYQHDLVIKMDSEIKAIGSVKTSSKDRLDKIFLDKYLYCKITEKDTPHFSIFLNDVQRKGDEGKYGINSTFLAGHFKVYSVMLNPLDGVYYCDLRPNMKTDTFFKTNIKSLDHFFVEDVWKFI